jgi:hypothetical protein
MMVRFHPSRPVGGIAQWQSPRLISGRPWFDSTCLYQTTVDSQWVVIGSNYKPPTSNWFLQASWSNGMISRCLREGRGSTPREVARAYRLTARTSGSHPDGRGSNPRTLTRLSRCGPEAGRLPREQENAGSSPAIATPRFVQWQDASPTKKRRVFNSPTGDQFRRCSPTAGRAFRKREMWVRLPPAAPNAGATRCAPTRL